VRRLRCLVVAALVVASASTVPAGCGGGGSRPTGIDDPAATASAGTVPDWYTAPFRPPAGSVVVEAIDDPESGLGRTVTWRVPSSYDDTIGQVEATFHSLGWKPTDRKDDSEGGSRQTSFYVENEQVYAIRIFADAALKGVRLTVELPAGS
jgi:hypothetical protein